MYLRLMLLFACLCSGLCLTAQEVSDTAGAARPAADTTLVTAKPVMPLKTDSLFKTPFLTPKKIGLFSAIVPGLGQFYNKQYWKVGVIYAGVGVAVYFVSDNLKNYNDFRRLYAAYQSNNKSITDNARYSASEAKGLQDYYRRNLDLTVLLSALGYTLQVVDAVVFAHLKNFDISEDITLRARPVLMPQGGIGFGLVMNFK